MTRFLVLVYFDLTSSDFARFSIVILTPCELTRISDCFDLTFFNCFDEFFLPFRAAKDLFNYVSVDLREIPADNLNAVLDYITKHMLDTVKGDASAKLGGVLAIVALINALDLIDVCKTDTRISRFGNFLCNTCLANATDPAVIEMSAKALARLTQVSGTYTATLKLQLIGNDQLFFK